MSNEFDREVNKIGRKKAIRFFAWRFMWIAFAIYMAIALYGKCKGATA